LRPRPHVLALNTKAQSSLWTYGISGDLPIIVARIDKAADLPTIRKLVRGHEYLHYKGLKIDLVILNAGIGDSAPFQRTKRESWDRIIATNLTALFDGTQLALPDLLDGDDKRLIIVASVAGLRGAAYAAPYVASKHGAVGLAKSLALEFAKTNLTVNAVCPSFVDTPMVDESAERISRVSKRTEEEARQALAAMNANGRLVTAEEVADTILHLCKPSSRSINGACITIDGGTTA